MLRRNGFTLIETLLVVALIALLATALSSRFSSSTRAQLEGAARQFAAHLVYMRERAMQTGVAHTCEGLRTTKDGYHLYQGTSTVTEIVNPWTGTSPFTIYFQDSGYKSVTWQTSPNFTIAFDAIGVPTVTGISLSGGQYTLTLTNGSATQSVRVVTATGLVR